MSIGAVRPLTPSARHTVKSQVFLPNLFSQEEPKTDQFIAASSPPGRRSRAATVPHHRATTAVLLAQVLLPANTLHDVGLYGTTYYERKEDSENTLVRMTSVSFC